MVEQGSGHNEDGVAVEPANEGAPSAGTVASDARLGVSNTRDSRSLHPPVGPHLEGNEAAYIDRLVNGGFLQPSACSDSDDDVAGPPHKRHKHGPDLNEWQHLLLTVVHHLPQKEANDLLAMAFRHTGGDTIWRDVHHMKAWMDKEMPEVGQPWTETPLLLLKTKNRGEVVISAHYVQDVTHVLQALFRRGVAQPTRLQNKEGQRLWGRVELSEQYHRLHVSGAERCCCTDWSGLRCFKSHPAQIFSKQVS